MGRACRGLCLVLLLTACGVEPAGVWGLQAVRFETVEPGGRIRHRQWHPDGADEVRVYSQDLGTLDEPVAVVAGSRLRMDLTLDVSPTTAGQLVVSAALEAPSDAPQLGAIRLTLAPGDQRARARLVLKPLPEQPGLVPLRVAASFTPDGASEPVAGWATTHPVALAWDRPRPGTPVYGQTARWAAGWATGLPARSTLSDAQAEAATLALARRLNQGIATLADTPHAFGFNHRPARFADLVGLFLGKPVNTCAEFSGLLLGLLGFHGVEAGWVTLVLPGTVPGAPTRYRTRVLPAVGRDAGVWGHSNHAVVEVGGHIFDPSYTLEAPSLAAFEDDLFAQWCTPVGPDAPEPEWVCVDNPPGFTPGDPFQVLRGTDY